MFLTSRNPKWSTDRISNGVTSRLECQDFTFFFPLSVLLGLCHFYRNETPVHDRAIKRTPDWKGGFWPTAGDSGTMGAG